MPEPAEPAGQAAAEAPRPAVEGLRALLETSLRITLTDGRVLVGTLQCADKQGNLVLHTTREFLPNGCAKQQASRLSI